MGPVIFRMGCGLWAQMVRGARKCPAVGRGLCIAVGSLPCLSVCCPVSGSLVMKRRAFAGMLRVCRLAGVRLLDAGLKQAERE